MKPTPSLPTPPEEDEPDPLVDAGLLAKAEWYGRYWKSLLALLAGLVLLSLGWARYPNLVAQLLRWMKNLI